MGVAKEIAHVVPVGYTPDKLIASMRQYPIHRIILLTHEGDGQNEKVLQAVETIKKSFVGINIEERIIVRNDLFGSVLDILDIVEEQINEGRVVKINISGGLRDVGIAAYIVSLVTGVCIYTDIPGLTDSGAYLLKGIQEISSFPIKEIAKEQMDILNILQTQVESQDLLIGRLKPELKKGTTHYNNERSRLSHHIKRLRMDNFVDTEKQGKNVAISRSVLGEIYVRGKQITKLISEMENS